MGINANNWVQLHNKRANPDRPWPYPDKQCAYRDCQTMIYRPLHNQRWCPEHAIVAKQEENRWRELCKTMSPDEARRHVDDLYALRQAQRVAAERVIEGETWKPVVNHPLYEVSTHGRIQSLHQYPAVMLVGSRDPLNGVMIYLAVGDGDHSWQRLHRLIKEAFDPIAAMNQYRVIHKNRDLFDNRLENLAWMHKSLIRGQGAKFNLDIAREIRRLYFEEHMLQKDIAELYQTRRATITEIVNGHSYPDEALGR